MEFLLHLGQGISDSGNLSSIRVREFLLQGIFHSGTFSYPSMNFSSLRGLQGRREFLPSPGPPGEAGISHTLHEFLIQGIIDLANLW